MLYIQIEAIRDAERLVVAEGNVGRKMKRLLTRIFNVGRFSCVFDVKAKDALDIALFQRSLNNAVVQVAGSLAGACFSIRAEAQQRFVNVVITPLGIPQGLRERKALLKAFLQVIQPIQAAAEQARKREQLDAMRRQYLCGRPAEVAERDIKDLEKRFRSQASGVYRFGRPTLELVAVDVLLNESFASAVLAA